MEMDETKNISKLPKKTLERVKGIKYMRKNSIVIWMGKY
jgi:hypothetical protein